MHQRRRPKNLRLQKSGPLLTRLMIHMYRLAKEQWPMKFFWRSSKRIDCLWCCPCPCRWRRPYLCVSTYIKETDPRIEVIGVEAEGARSMKAAFEAGGPVKLPEIDKFADGIAVQKWTIDLWSDPSTCGNFGWGWWRLDFQRLWLIFIPNRIVAEPAGAASVASLEILREYIKGKTICCIISGGNNDINRMPEMEERALIYDGVKHYLSSISHNVQALWICKCIFSGQMMIFPHVWIHIKRASKGLASLD